MAETIANKLDPTHTLIIRHARFKAAYESIQECFDSFGTRAQPLCRILTGPSGSGKTTLLSIFEAEHPPVDTPSGPIRPCISVTVPPQATPRTLAEQFLISMKDPYPSRGTVADLGRRIDKALGGGEEGHQVRVVALQEAQRLVDSPWVVLWDIGNLLRERIETTGCSFILSGLDYAEEIVDGNEQLQRLFDTTITLGFFDWSESDDRTSFRGILRALKTALSDIYHLPDIDGPDLAFRLQWASYGLIGYLMNIIRGAAELARKRHSNEITQSLLGESFGLHIRRRVHRTINPFYETSFTPEHAPALVLPHAQISQRNAARRSRPRKAPRLSAKSSEGM